MTRSDASLKGKIKAIAKKSGLKPQELLQMYLFEHLLMRLEKSDYAETFVLKGGLLISSMTGIAQRTTMDTDATVVGMDMDEGTVSAAISSICSVDVGDGMEYSFERLEPITQPFSKRSGNPASCRASGPLTSPGRLMRRGSTSRISSTQPSSSQDLQNWMSWDRRGFTPSAMPREACSTAPTPTI